MFPCRKCIVRACCTQQCDEYKRTKRLVCDVFAPLFFIGISLIVVAGIFLCQHYLPIKTFANIFIATWGLSISISTLILKQYQEKALFVICLFFGPIMTLWLLEQVLISKYAKGEIL